MSPHPLDSLLPAFTFLTGPNGVGKSTLAFQLFANIDNLQSFSFADPLREAIVGMFYEGDITIDLTQEQIKSLPIPGFPTKTHREAINALGDWYKSFFGPRAIGEYALHRVKLDADYFQKFVFDDARRLADVAPLIEEFGAENCLIINVKREGKTFSQPHHYVHDAALLSACRTVTFRNDVPIDRILASFTETLEAAHASTENA